MDHWFAERPQKPAEVASGAWPSWEQRKHERLLATRPTPESMEPSVA